MDALIRGVVSWGVGLGKGWGCQHLCRFCAWKLEAGMFLLVAKVEKARLEFDLLPMETYLGSTEGLSTNICCTFQVESSPPPPENGRLSCALLALLLVPLLPGTLTSAAVPFRLVSLPLQK